MQHTTRVLCASLLAGVLPAQASPPTETAQQEPEAGTFFEEVWTSPRLFGDFGGIRRDLENNGINVDLYYNAWLGWNSKGGANTGNAHRYSHSFDLFVRADTESMGLWRGGSALMQVKNNYGKNINPDSGAMWQPVDDADFNHDAYVDQLYYEHDFAESGVRLRAGYLDYQTIIDRNAYANSEDVMFMSLPLDNNPTVPLKIGFGATLWLDLSDELTVIFGTADATNVITDAGWESAFGDTDDLMAYGEVTIRTKLESDGGELPGNYRWGLYHDPLARTRYDGMRERGTLGTWISVDQKVYREQDEDLQGLGVFARFGYRDDDVYRVSHFYSGGVEYRGLLEGRDADACGVAVYDGAPSDQYEKVAAAPLASERGFEAYYRFQVTPWLAVTPDVQYIQDPGGVKAGKDALVFVLRGRVKF